MQEAFQALDEVRRKLEAQTPETADVREIPATVLAKLQDCLLANLSENWGTPATLESRLCPNDVPIKRGKVKKKSRDDWRWDAICTSIQMRDLLKKHGMDLNIDQFTVNELIETLYLQATAHDLLHIFETHVVIPSHATPIIDEIGHLTIEKIQACVIETIRESRELSANLLIDEHAAYTVGLKGSKKKMEQACHLDVADTVSTLIEETDLPKHAIKEGENAPVEVIKGTIGDIARWIYRKYNESLAAGK